MDRKRWPVTLVIIAAVVITSVIIAVSYHDTSGGIPVATISDASGDIIVTWQNSKGIFVQRIDLSGQSLWGEDGVLVSGFPPEKSYTLTSDGAGGAIVIWYETSDNIEHDDPDYFNPVTLYAQRVNTDGELIWGNGILIGNTNRIGVRYPDVVTDSSGGAIFAWNDYEAVFRALHDDILRLKKIDAAGDSLWGDEGVIVAASSPFHPLTEEEITAGIKGTYTRSWPTYSGQFAAVNDGAGGVIVTWEEEITNRSDRIYAQRFNEQGDVVWPSRLTVAGEKLASAESDGSGGVIVKTPEGTVYSGIGQVGKQLIARINSYGEILSSWEYSHTIIQDGTGGFIRIRIEEDPSYGPPWERQTTLYLQRQDEAGQPRWPEKLVIKPDEEKRIGNLEFVTDGTGGVIVVWRLVKDSVSYGSLMAQRIDAEGEFRWGESGIPLFADTSLKYQGISEVFSDGSGGVIIIAELGTGALNADMAYAQRLDADGNLLWGDGIRIGQ
jgi:hypothetical protein